MIEVFTLCQCLGDPTELDSEVNTVSVEISSVCAVKRDYVYRDCEDRISGTLILILNGGYELVIGYVNSNVEILNSHGWNVPTPESVVAAKDKFKLNN